MYEATCADCGATCSVPFRPKGDRPIYCKACFGKHNTRESNFQPSNSGEKPLFRTKCDNCGKPCEVPFRPTGEKPVYCRECFGQRSGRSDSRRPESQGMSGQLNEQIRAMNIKLDAILAVLAPAKKFTVKEDTKNKKVTKPKKAGKKKK